MTATLLLLMALAQAPAPTGTITGVVIDAQTRTPLSNASVRLTPDAGRGINRSVVTDAEGRFTLEAVPQGRYVLSASRQGYLPTNLGQRRQGGPGTAIELADGEARDKITIPMTRGGVITGRVVDDHGDPVTGATVQLLPRQGGTPPARTDDRGVYRLFALTPGEYVVQAQLSFMAHVGAFAKAGPISTFYPNTTDPRAAQRVRVAAGGEVSGLNITLVTASLADVSGRAMNARGAPMDGATVNLIQRLGSMTSPARADLASRPRRNGVARTRAAACRGLHIRVEALVRAPPSGRLDESIIRPVGRQINSMA
jgi:hypothetical protein